MIIQEAIVARHSVRAYKPQPLSEEIVKVLEDEIVKLNDEAKLHIQLICNEPKAFQGTLAKYGKFRNVNNYLVMAGKKADDLDERIGYYGEHLVLLFSAFFSGTEIAFLSSSKLRFEMDRERQGFTSRLIDTFYNHSSDFISTILIGNNIALVIYGILMARLVNDLILTPLGIHNPNGYCPNDAVCLLIQTLLGTAITIVTGEFLPKTLFRINPNRMLTICALPAYVIYILLWPISKFTSMLSKLMLRLLGQKTSKAKNDKTFRKADLDYLIQSNIESAEEGGNIEDEVKIFQNALDFSSVKVRDCTIPRTEINAVDEQTDSATLLNTFVESGHSKIIVYRGDIDNIIGFIHSSEMFRLSPVFAWGKRRFQAKILCA